MTRMSSSATSIWTWCARCATTGSSTATAGPTPTPASHSPDPPAARGDEMKTLIQNGTVVSATGRASADVLIDGETIPAVLAPGPTLLGFALPRPAEPGGGAEVVKSV